MSESSKNMTQLLSRYAAGDGSALEKLLPFLYAELHRLAESYMRRERAGHTLQPTALVNEAFTKLLNEKAVTWENRSHFFGAAAQAMRRILIEHARAKAAQKRGGNPLRVEFTESLPAAAEDVSQPDLLALDVALTKLAEIDPRRSKVVELRYFGGLSLEETAEILQTSVGTVKRDWTVAKAWLHHELSGQKDD